MSTHEDTGVPTSAALVSASGPDDRDSCVVPVPLGRRVEIIGDLLLPAEPTDSSRAACRDIARRLREWQGPGIVIICGRLTALCCTQGPVQADVLDAHPELTEAFGQFSRRPDSRVLAVPAEGEEGAQLAQSMERLGVEMHRSVDLSCETGVGLRTVLVRNGALRRDANAPAENAPNEDRPWLEGMERLDDPLRARRFVTSRLLYRRLRRFLWAPPLALAVVALALRIDFVIDGLGRVFRSPRQQNALQRAYAATWFSRFVVTILIAVLLLVVLALVVAITSRGIWRALGGENLPAPWSHGPAGSRPIAHQQLTIEDMDALDATRAALAGGASGLVAGGALVPELSHLDAGFFACPGATSEVVHEHRGRLGLPPTFLVHRQLSTLEIETGADLHVRLNLAEVDLPTATLGERLVTSDVAIRSHSRTVEVPTELAASWPGGASWPPAPDVAADHIRVRRIRRLAAVSLFVAGAIDLLSAVTAPLRTHLHLIAQYLPITVVQAAGALTAISGLAMIMLSRGILRGQRRSWVVAVALLSASLGLHLVHAADVITLLVCAAVLTLLIVERERFRAKTEPATLVTAFAILAVGGALATLGAFVAVEVAGRVHHHALPGWPEVLAGSAERLVGVSWVAFPPTIDRYTSVSLLAVGFSLIVVALYLLTRPVVDRRLSSGRAHAGRRAAELRARDIVRRHGTGTLDYFALRDDKQWFFHRDTLVAYAVWAASAWSRPIRSGRTSSGTHVWDSFRHYADATVDLGSWARARPGSPYQRSGCATVHRRRGRRRHPPVLPRRRQDEGPTPGRHRVGPPRLHREFLDPARLDPAPCNRLAD